MRLFSYSYRIASKSADLNSREFLASNSLFKFACIDMILLCLYALVKHGIV